MNIHVLRHGATSNRISPRARSRGLLCSTAIVGLFATLATPVPVRAACTTLDFVNYTCSSTNTSGQAVGPANNPTVTTQPGFSVNTSDPIALHITGNGALSYNDANNATLTSTGTDGLNVAVGSDSGSTPGSVTINTGGDITGVRFGVYALSDPLILHPA